ncbi:hypothetical protein F4815DRAFT_463794, partial [Daldinia loculata]
MFKSETCNRMPGTFYICCICFVIIRLFVVKRSEVESSLILNFIIFVWAKLSTHVICHL